MTKFLYCLSHLKHLMSISCGGMDGRRYDSCATFREYAGVKENESQPISASCHICGFAVWFRCLESKRAQPRPLRYVSEWEVPRDRWNEFETSADHTIRPMMELQMKQRAILSWGIYRSMLIQDG